MFLKKIFLPVFKIIYSSDLKSSSISPTTSLIIFLFSSSVCLSSDCIRMGIAFLPFFKRELSAAPDTFLSLSKRAFTSSKTAFGELISAINSAALYLFSGFLLFRRADKALNADTPSLLSPAQSSLIINDLIFSLCLMVFIRFSTTALSPKNPGLFKYASRVVIALIPALIRYAFARFETVVLLSKRAGFRYLCDSSVFILPIILTALILVSEFLSVKSTDI